MSKNTKKRAIIYSNVKENKKKAEELAKIKENQINLNDEVIIGLSSKSQKQNQNSKNKSTKKEVKQNKTKNEKKKRNQKNKKKMSILTKIILIIIVLMIGLILFCNTPVFDVKEITININNNNVLTELGIKELSQIDIGQNIYSINKRKLADLIKSNPYVGSVKIKKSLPNKVKIEIEERSIKFQLQHDNTYIYVDNQGYILEEVEEKKDVLVIDGYSTTDLSCGNRLNVEDLEKLSDVMQIMQEARNSGLEDKITKIDIADDNNYKIYFENLGKMAHLGTTNSINEKLTYVKKILEMESEYEGEIIVDVDLNNGEYPYFREKV